MVPPTLQVGNIMIVTSTSYYLSLFIHSHLPMLAHTVTLVEVASGTTQQNLPVGIITSLLRRFRLTSPLTPLVRENRSSSPSLETTPPLSGKYHSPCLFASIGDEQHGLLSVMHWSPLFGVCPISVMRMTLLLGYITPFSKR